jgi:hypothetical protein
MDRSGLRRRRALRRAAVVVAVVLAAWGPYRGVRISLVTVEAGSSGRASAPGPTLPSASSAGRPTGWRTPESCYSRPGRRRGHVRRCDRTGERGWVHVRSRCVCGVPRATSRCWRDLGRDHRVYRPRRRGSRYCLDPGSTTEATGFGHWQVVLPRAAELPGRDYSGPMVNGPDFSAVDSAAKAEQLAQSGQLERLLLLPPQFGGQAVAANVVYVPVGMAEVKQSIDENVVAPLVAEGRVTRYSATPGYSGNSFVPVTIQIVASDPGSFTTTLNLWGDALDQA